MGRDLDLVPQDRVDARRLEVVADGLPVFSGAQLALDTIHVSLLKRDGTPQARSQVVDEKRKRKHARTSHVVT